MTPRERWVAALAEAIQTGFDHERAKSSARVAAEVATQWAEKLAMEEREESALTAQDWLDDEQTAVETREQIRNRGELPWAEAIRAEEARDA